MLYAYKSGRPVNQSRDTSAAELSHITAHRKRDPDRFGWRHRLIKSDFEILTVWFFPYCRFWDQTDADRDTARRVCLWLLSTIRTRSTRRLNWISLSTSFLLSTRPDGTFTASLTCGGGGCKPKNLSKEPLRTLPSQS